MKLTRRLLADFDKNLLLLYQNVIELVPRTFIHNVKNKLPKNVFPRHEL